MPVFLFFAIVDDRKNQRSSRMSTRVEHKPSTTRRMIWMIVGVLLLIALIVGIKVLLVMRMIHGMPKPAPFTVSTTTAREQPWQPSLSAVGTLRAVNGADLAMDVAGLVTAVNLKSGADVKQGQLLLQLRDGDDVAQLQQFEAAAQLAKITFERARQQLAAQAISKAEYDSAAADLKAGKPRWPSRPWWLPRSSCARRLPGGSASAPPAPATISTPAPPW